MTALLLLWASPVMAITLDELPTFNYEIGQVEIELTQSNAWDRKDTALLALRLIDWGQTREIATSYYDPYHVVKNGEEEDIIVTHPRVYKYREINPLLGEHPSLGEVDRYFILCIGTDVLMAKYATPKVKKWWRIIGITLETYCVTHNFQSGIKIKF